MGVRRKPTAPERDRAHQALALKTQGLSYEVIARRLGYRGEAGPRRAVDRLLSRREHEGAAQLRKVEGARLDRLQAAIWDKAIGGNLGAIREVLRICERRARLYGLDKPIAVAVEGITADQFAQQAAELLATIGPGPLFEAAGLPAPPQPVVVEAEPDEVWSNIGSPEPWAVQQARALVEAYGEPQDVSDRSPDPGAENQPVVSPAAEDDDQGDGVEEVEAELVDEVIEQVALPPACKLIAASEIVDGGGVPVSRAGIARRLGGYDPLAGSRLGRTPMLEGPDPMPTGTLPTRG